MSSHLNFDIGCCPINNDFEVTTDLLQIRADASEINRRIASFIGRKRSEINCNNSKDFITDQSEDEMKCARVNSTVYRIKGSKGHLKVHRVKNETGPQITSYKNALDKLMGMRSLAKYKSDPDAPANLLSSSIEERLTNAEDFFKIPNENVSAQSVARRLKALEDRILFLETLSPEYIHFLVCIFILYFIIQVHTYN